jgi:hypothetical protein
MTIGERIQNDKARVIGETRIIMAALKPRLDEFFEAHQHSSANEEISSLSPSGEIIPASSSMIPAVDLASGRGVATIQLAAAFYKELEFYPSDYQGSDGPDAAPVDVETRKSLQYHLDSSTVSEPLFSDSAGNDEPVFQDDFVELHGLTAVQFNGQPGLIRGLDTQTEGRFAVELSDGRKSFKKENIKFAGCLSLGDAHLRILKLQHKVQDFFKGLLERTRQIDILQHDTWSNLEELNNRCGLVTCMNVLSCLGYRDPTAWHDILELSSTLLQVGGLLFQFDASGYAGFGDNSAMNEFVTQRKLPLELVENNICEDMPAFITVIWRRTDSDTSLE